MAPLNRLLPRPPLLRGDYTEVGKRSPQSPGGWGSWGPRMGGGSTGSRALARLRTTPAGVSMGAQNPDACFAALQRYPALTKAPAEPHYRPLFVVDSRSIRGEHQVR